MTQIAIRKNTFTRNSLFTLFLLLAVFASGVLAQDHKTAKRPLGRGKITQNEIGVQANPSVLKQPPPPGLEVKSPWTAARRELDAVFTRKWNELRGRPGAPLVSGLNGIKTIKDGYYREYNSGRIYYRPGGEAFQNFGIVGERYLQLGGPASWLGWPTSDQDVFTENGFVATFEHGAIYWWADTGVIELGHVVVRYTGMYCFGETDNDQQFSFSSKDEPYAVFAIADPTGQGRSLRTQIYEEVDAGDWRGDSIELYRGLPYGMSLSVALWEHDFSDADKKRDLVKKGADAAAKSIASATAAIPKFGPAIAVLLHALWEGVGDSVVTFLNKVLNFEDDHIDTKSFTITAKEMVTMARAAKKQMKGIQWHLDSPLLSGDGASYKIYVTIEAL